MTTDTMTSQGSTTQLAMFTVPVDPTPAEHQRRQIAHLRVVIAANTEWRDRHMHNARVWQRVIGTPAEGEYDRFLYRSTVRQARTRNHAIVRTSRALRRMTEGATA